MGVGSEHQRPDPDALLAHAKRAERGRLRVYLGMSPGVGKTYEMLETAARRKAEGCDVVIGLVETHGRRETEALVEGLEVLPRIPVEHRGRMLMEFDLDAALARRPALILVDEYAHTNAPGARHPKRWQDVEELLAAGIDVWTTLNVQHLESLVDVVWKITGVRVRETVPDQALTEADQIRVVDITPEELRARLESGKVYVPETARLAGDRFFKLENLTALRELALRRAAQTVDDHLNAAMKRGGIEGPWAAGERILVLIAGDPMAPALVRAGRRLADLMGDAPWTVTTVELSNRAPITPDRGRRIAEAFKLAEQLNGSTLVLTGEDLPGVILDYARRNNVTQIVLGKPPPRRLTRLLGRDLAQALLDRSGGAAVHFVTEAAPEPTAAAKVKAALTRQPGAWTDYLTAGLLTAAATGVSFLLDRASASADLGMIYLAAVLVTGLLGGLRPALVSAALAVLIYNFLFLEPRFSFVIGRPADLLTFAIFFGAAGVTGWLSGRVRDEGRLSARRAAAVAALLAASRRLSGAATRSEAAQALAEQASAAAGGQALVLLPKAGEIAIAAGAPDTAVLSTAETAAARWAWEKGEPAGKGTGTLPQIAWTFHPLEGVRGVSGVAGVSATHVAPEDERLLAALLDQGAVALERADLAAAQARDAAARRSDRLRGALLNSISHDLRTPLATVMGSASTLIELGDALSGETRADLLLSIREEAERLNRYVGDLLDMTRLEGDALKPRRELTDVRDVLGAAIGRVERRLGGRALHRDFPPDLSLVELDPALLEQAVVNILENAVAYSPDDAPIEVAAYEDRSNVVLSIEDEGKGIPTQELERVFDRFRRVDGASDLSRGDRTKGVGLGLSISKGFVEAMGGRIAAASPIHGAPDGTFRGTRILISLPKAAPPPPAPE